jgi:glycosyltransferase involved in cell wall biosynthesis
MKIAYYSYDHIGNPHCGGGGAYRDLMINRELSSRHEVHCYYGAFKGCMPVSEKGLHISFLGIPLTYLVGRITYALFATLHSLFVRADITVICFSIFAPVLSFVLRRKKTVIELFHLAQKEPFRKYSLFGVFPWLFEKAALLFGVNIVCINTGVAAYISDHYKGKNIATIYTGFDQRLLALDAGDGHYILYLGRIDIHMKGLDTLCDAFERIAPDFPDYRLLFAGRGSAHDTEWLRRRIASSGFADRMTFRENVSDREKADLLCSATFACMPSRFEGWCISAIEAAACLKATIGTRITGLSESIIDGKTGLLVPAEDVGAIAGAIASLLRDPALRSRLGGNGRERARRFTWDALALQHEEYYRSIFAP